MIQSSTINGCNSRNGIRRLNAAGLADYEPDLNEDPVDRWDNTGISDVWVVSKSYVGAVKEVLGDDDMSRSPAMLMDDDCLMSWDVPNAILGRVREFASLANLKMALSNEGFVDFNIRYMGEFWVMMEFANTDAIKKFRESVGVGTWFSTIKEASSDFHTDKRIAWVEIEGVPFKLWSGKTFKRIATKWGELLDVDDQEDTCFHSKRLCIHTKLEKSISEDFKIIHRGIVYWIRAKETPGWVPDFAEEPEEEDQDGFIVDDDEPKKHFPTRYDSDREEDQEKKANEGGDDDNNLEEGEVKEEFVKSEDPFNLYPMLNKKVHKGGSESTSEGSLKYPPGFKQVVYNEGESFQADDGNNFGDQCSNKSQPENANSGIFKKFKEEGTDSMSCGHFKTSEAPRTGGSILGLLEEVVKVGQGLAKKAKKEWVRELCNKYKVNFLTLQETKMESMDVFCARRCWGNMAFEYVHSEAVGNSGGVLCMWDPNCFTKKSVTKSDSFVLIRGEWRLSGQNLMVIAVYGPQDAREKCMLWDYLQGEILRWKGAIIVMGDFNEVRNKEDRFGSVFNAHEASIFNSFIQNSGLVEVELGGCSFTWCHKSASKMSKLDRFLVSDSLLNICPNFNAITLERFLSDHRPILLREIYFDYGPIPFKTFHYWFEMEGFHKLVEDSWKNYSGVESNAFLYLMGKMKYLKNIIKSWNTMRRPSVIQEKRKNQNDLASIE
ncbi:RNA-directed DNA polymerase, eukaryota [Tanacetum coccineum]